jgi:hypothetical protein
MILFDLPFKKAKLLVVGWIRLAEIDKSTEGIKAA